MGIFAKVWSWLTGSSPSVNGPDSFSRLTWLEPDENPFGVRVLDCRPIAESFLSATENPGAISFFRSPESQSGLTFRGKHPEDPIRVSCQLLFSLTEPLREGPVFLAAAMEEKWNIYHFDRILYFARSWTGQLCYVAKLGKHPESSLFVVEVEAWPGCVVGENQLAVRQVEYLINSHLLNKTAPHPVPALESDKAIALWSFQQYGRRGCFAVPEGNPLTTVDSS